MKFRLGAIAIAIASGSLLTFSLVGCNPPVDEAGKKPDTPVINPGTTTPSTTPTDMPKPGDTPVPSPTTPPPSVEAPKDTPKPGDTPATPPAVEAPKAADPAPAPKDESKKEETPK